MTLHERLSRIVESALPGTLIPVSSLRELLEAHQAETGLPSTASSGDPGLSLEEVAERCAARGRRRKPVGTATVRSWIRTGLRGVKLNAFRWGSTYRVTEDALERFILAVQAAKDDAEDPRANDAAGPRTIQEEIEAAYARYSHPHSRRGSLPGKHT